MKGKGHVVFTQISLNAPRTNDISSAHKYLRVLQWQWYGLRSNINRIAVPSVEPVAIQLNRYVPALNNKSYGVYAQSLTAYGS